MEKKIDLKPDNIIKPKIIENEIILPNELVEYQNLLIDKIKSSNHVFLINDFDIWDFLNHTEYKEVIEQKLPFNSFGIASSSNQVGEKAIKSIENNAMITACYIDSLSNNEYGFICNFISNDTITEEAKDGLLVGNSIDSCLDVEPAGIFAKNFIGNFLNLINSKHCSFINGVCDAPRHQRRRLEKEGRTNNFITIRIDEYLKNIIFEDRELRDKTALHWVRGFWRLLQSEFYTNKRNQLVWSRPHLSGKGELKNKPYLIKK